MDLRAVFPPHHPYSGPDLLWPLGPCTGKVSEADGVLTSIETVLVTGWGISYFIHGAAGERALESRKG